MGVKYVKDFEYPSSGGFHSSKMPSKARASERGMPKAVKKAEGGYIPDETGQYRPPSVIYPSAQVADETGQYRPPKLMTPTRKVAPPPPPREKPITYMPVPEKYTSKKEAAMARLRDARARQRAKKYPPMPIRPAGFAKGGMNKVSKVMSEYKEGKLHSGSKKGPVVKNRKQAVAIALSEARKAGAKIPKKAEGGIFSTEYMASKGPKTRGTARKGRLQARMERRSRESMERAEKYAPGLSLDMPDKKSGGGMPVHRRKPMYGGGKC